MKLLFVSEMLVWWQGDLVDDSTEKYEIYWRYETGFFRLVSEFPSLNMSLQPHS